MQAPEEEEAEQAQNAPVVVDTVSETLVAELHTEEEGLSSVVAEQREAHQAFDLSADRL